MPEPLVPVPSGPISVKKRGDIDAPMAHKTKRGPAETNDEAPPSGYEADAEKNEADIFYHQADYDEAKDGTAEYSGNKDKSKAETIQTIQKEADYVGPFCQEYNNGQLVCWEWK